MSASRKAKAVKKKPSAEKKGAKGVSKKNASSKTSRNGHIQQRRNKTQSSSKSKASQKSKSKAPRKKSAMEDAISKFAKTIDDQLKLIDKLKEENMKLKKEVDDLKTKKKDVKVVYLRSKPKVPTTLSPQTAEPNRAPAIRIQKAKPSPPPRNKTNDKDAVITSVSKEDAKNALSGLFGSKPATIKKAKSAMLLANTMDADEDETTNLSICTPFRLVKYEKLSKIMPSHVLLNRMKMDGVQKVLIAQMTKEWLPALLPDGFKRVNREVLAPPQIPKAFRHLIESKTDDNETQDEEMQLKLKDLGLKAKKKIIPSQKMKRFHWKKIDPEDIPPTLWMKMDESKIKYNKIEFELKFAFRTTKPAATKKAAHNKQDRTGQVYTFVLPKRSQNIQIALSRFKQTDSEFKTAIITMDESVFNIDLLEKFIEIAPNEDEQREAETHANKEDVDPQYFGRSERFVYQFVDVVDLSQRLQLWLFMMNFKEIVSDREYKCYKLQSACDALKQCQSFDNILRLLLAWGNHMNGGSHAGQAYGFEIDSLQLLPMIKTMDNQMNLMMYLYKTVYEKFPDYLSVMKDLKVIKVCATMDTDMLDRTVNDIKLKFDELKSTLLRFEEDYLEVLSEDDAFVKKSKLFMKQNKKLLAKLLMIHKRTKSKCEQLGTMFHWNLNENRIEGLFNICNNFILDLYKARDDVHKLEIERDKKRKKRLRKAKKKKNKETMKNIQNHKRSIMDDVKHRKRKATILIAQLGPKLANALMEKSKLIEANNFRKELPESVKKNKVKNKVSSLYAEKVLKVRPVSHQRMRLPSISAVNINRDSKQVQSNKDKNDNKVKVKVKKRKKRRKKTGIQTRKRTSGWFPKGKEPQALKMKNATRDMKGLYAQPIIAYDTHNHHKEKRQATALSKLNVKDQLDAKRHKRAKTYNAKARDGHVVKKKTNNLELNEEVDWD